VQSLCGKPENKKIPERKFRENPDYLGRVEIKATIF
jgi:hypothetical protein